MRIAVMLINGLKDVKILAYLMSKEINIHKLSSNVKNMHLQ